MTIQDQVSLGNSSILENYRVFTDAIVGFVNQQDDLRAAELMRSGEAVTDLTSLGLSEGDLSNGDSTIRDLTDPIHLLRAWRKGQASTNYPLTRMARETFICYGVRAPLSDNLDQSEFPEFFDLTNRGLTSIGDHYDGLRLAGIGAISRGLFNEAINMHSAENIYPMSRPRVLANVEAALGIIGYPNKRFGRLILRTASIWNKFTPHDFSNNPFDLAS